jgi:hypothetical protein
VKSYLWLNKYYYATFSEKLKKYVLVCCGKLSDNFPVNVQQNLESSQFENSFISLGAFISLTSAFEITLSFCTLETN